MRGSLPQIRRNIYTYRALTNRSHETEETGTDTDDDLDDPQEQFAFLDLDNKIKKAIEDYEGVFPKLNFSSPKVSFKAHSLILNWKSYDL